jgi:hypothetical protein
MGSVWKEREGGSGEKYITDAAAEARVVGLSSSRSRGLPRCKLPRHFKSCGDSRDSGVAAVRPFVQCRHNLPTCESQLRVL